jgi:hypothetical protein
VPARVYRYVSGTCVPDGAAAGGSSIVMVCSMPGSPRCRACRRKIAVAAQAEDASRVQPQEQVTNQLAHCPP